MTGAALVLVTCLIGAYSVAGSVVDVAVALVFGAVGYVFKKLDYPVAPLVLAMVLGDRAEIAFRQSMILGGGSLGIFWNSGIGATLSTLALFIRAYPLLAARRRRRTLAPRRIQPSGPDRRRKVGSASLR